MKNLMVLISLLLSSYLLESCTKEDTGCPQGSETDSLIIQLSKDTLEFDQFSFTTIKVLDKSGNDVTAECSYFANGFKITTENNYYPLKTGTVIITASSQCQPSVRKTLTIIRPTDSTFTQKLLVEDLTGTWCGFCTRAADKLHTFKQSNSKLVVTAIHGGSSQDPFQYSSYTSYLNYFKLSGFPSVMINRKEKWNESNYTAFDAALQNWAPLGLAITSSSTADSISGTVNVKFNVSTERPLKLVIQLVENDLVHPQVNYYSSKYGYTPYLYGGVSPVNDFVHEGVLRKTATDLFGDAIPTEVQLKGNEYSKSFSLSTSGKTYQNTSFKMISANSAIVAFVVDEKTNKVYNVQYAPFGATKNYD
jgi:hypothetical protein